MEEMAFRAFVVINQRSISRGSTKDVTNYQIRGNKTNCNAYRVQVNKWE
jgi:hypothetical protein